MTDNYITQKIHTKWGEGTIYYHGTSARFTAGDRYDPEAEPMVIYGIGYQVTIDLERYSDGWSLRCADRGTYWDTDRKIEFAPHQHRDGHAGPHNIWQSVDGYKLSCIGIHLTHKAKEMIREKIVPLVLAEIAAHPELVKAGAIQQKRVEIERAHGAHEKALVAVNDAAAALEALRAELTALEG